MSNEALDRRIAEEFMGWEFIEESVTQVARWGNAQGAQWVELSDGKFKPTTDMRAAYMVLEKIASNNSPIWIEYFDDWNIEISLNLVSFKAKAVTLPLAISRLAEAIMDSPSHMELFK